LVQPDLGIEERKSMSRLTLFFLVLMLGTAGQQAAADDGSGLKISAAADIVAAFPAGGASGAPGRLDVREAELLLAGPIDHLFDGVLSAAAHRESGVALFEVHEAFIASPRLIPRSRLRFGQIFLGIGRLNRVHRHEWPFTTAPRYHQSFFGDEGLLDAGIEFATLAPLPFFLDLTLGVTNGWVWGHAHNEGSRPKQPLAYGRMATYTSLFGGGGSEVGLSHVRRRSADGEQVALSGLDLVAKWRRGTFVQVLIQGEAWHRLLRPEGAAEESAAGAYLFAQYGLSPSLLAGARFDYFSILSLKDASGVRMPNSDLGWTPALTYKASEFSTVRIGYTFAQASVSGAREASRRSAEIQTTFMLGAHPAHDF